MGRGERGIRGPEINQEHPPLPCIMDWDADLKVLVGPDKLTILIVEGPNLKLKIFTILLAI